jgi:hypothetical protein
MNAYTTTLKGRLSAAPRDYAQELGWSGQQTSEGTVFKGHYRAPGLRYDGWILRSPDGKLSFYILRPPMDLIRDTDYSNCFHARNDGWWLITFKPYDMPADVASGVASIQKVLRQAFGNRTAKRRRQ